MRRPGIDQKRRCDHDFAVVRRAPSRRDPVARARRRSARGLRSGARFIFQLAANNFLRIDDSLSRYGLTDCESVRRSGFERFDARQYDAFEIFEAWRRRRSRYG